MSVLFQFRFWFSPFRRVMEKKRPWVPSTLKKIRMDETGGYTFNLTHGAGGWLKLETCRSILKASNPISNKMYVIVDNLAHRGWSMCKLCPEHFYVNLITGYLEGYFSRKMVHLYMYVFNARWRSILSLLLDKNKS